MQKIGIFMRIKNAKLTVGLFSTMVIFLAFCFNANAASMDVMCPVCYKCIGSKNAMKCNGSCQPIVGCEPCLVGYEWDYIQAKCVETLGFIGCDEVEQCADPFEMDLLTCTCVCPNEGEGCEDGYSFDNTTCTCVQDAPSCDDGYYLLLGGCKKCPEYVSGTAITACGVHSMAPRTNGMTDCFKQASTGRFNLATGEVQLCQYSDETGSYEFTNDCYYDILSDVEIGGGKFEQINP